MPELPEVETIARTLREGGRGGPPLPGMQLIGVEILWSRTIQIPSVDEIKRRIPGQKIQDIYRRGKYLIIRLSNDYLIIHLRMSGDLRVESLLDAEDLPIPTRKHDRVLFLLHEKYRLVFEDARKFGRVWLVRDPAEVVGGLGPEPLDVEFTAHEFHRRLQAVHRQIKPLLLDQSFMAGMGNIYTDEALHRAHVHPLTLSHSLDEQQAERLLAAVRTVLQTGIRNNGASIDWVYRGGSFQKTLQVYGRANEPCYSCGNAIVKINVGQRGTHFCPVCQPIQSSQS